MQRFSLSCTFDLQITVCTNLACSYYSEHFTVYIHDSYNIPIPDGKMSGLFKPLPN